MKAKLASRELLSLDAQSFQDRLHKGLLTSVELVISCLAQVRRHDRQGAQLQAIVSLAPDKILLAKAEQLDEERKSGRVRSSLHGIPILVKDCIATSAELGLKTTLGSLALQYSEPSKSSPLVHKLVEMGAIILGKTNLNELLGVRGFANSNGWSGLVGQTKSAYIPFKPGDTGMEHSNPCGSSSGSAVGVAAGYSPIALGTDSIGSLVSPTTRAALFTVKPTVGSVDMSGIWPVSSYMDAVGGITRSVADLAVVTTCLVNSRATDTSQLKDFEKYLTGTFEGLRVGFLDPDDWVYPPDVVKPIQEVNGQIKSAVENTVDTIRNYEGAHVSYPVWLPPLSALDRNGRPTMSLAITYEIKKNVSHYLSTANVSNILSVEDIVEFNQDHAAEELPQDHPDQDWLLQGINDRPSVEEYEQDVAHFRRVARDEGIDKLFKGNNLNLLAFSMDSLVFSIASAAGYPIASMPLGLLDYNGRPFGLGLIAQGEREDLIFQFMSAFEKTFSPRPIPESLL